MPFGVEKLEWCGYRWWKNLWRILIRFDRMYERGTDTHTDGRTDTACWRAWRL